MPTTVITYDKDLPEVPDRLAHLPPVSYLRKRPDASNEVEIVEERRPSKLLLINRLRGAVEEWRKAGCPGASSVAERLFNYWFEEDHLNRKWKIFKKPKKRYLKSLLGKTSRSGRNF